MVVAEGDTDTEPPVGETLPTPLLMDALVAFDAVHVSVEDAPIVMEPGLAPSVPVGSVGGVTVVRLPAAS